MTSKQQSRQLSINFPNPESSDINRKIDDDPVSLIPKGFCQCGCGGMAPIAKESSTRRGHHIGEPMKFIWGHNRRGQKNKGTSVKGPLNHSWKDKEKFHNGYPITHCPGHPRAHKNYVFDHILRAEKVLGKPLRLPHIVHHHDPEQLVICENQAYHRIVHQRMRAFYACGNANWRKCVFCKVYDDPAKLTFPKTGNPYHRDCINERNRKYREKREKNANQVSKNL